VVVMFAGTTKMCTSGMPEAECFHGLYRNQQLEERIIGYEMKFPIHVVHVK